MKINKYTALLALTIAVTFLGAIHFNKRNAIFYCESHVDNFYKNTSFHSDFQIRIYNDHTGFIAHRGVFIIGDNKYNIDREVIFNLHDDNKDGVMILESRGVVKKPGDTVPDDIGWNKGYAAGLKYYPQLLKTINNDIIITEKGSPIYVCAKS